jgi:GNAT superfamily N-acetyltransferase
VRVRAATARDAKAIESLYRELVPGDGNVNVDGARLEELHGDRHNRLLVAEIDGYVWRGRGVGQTLMTAVEQEARRAGCTKLMLLSSAFREEAHAFFARVGFDGQRKRGFVKYLGRTTPLTTPG